VQYLFEPIGVVRSPFAERLDAPRQAVAAHGKGTPGRIELHPGRGFEDALEGLDAWEYAWVLFVFHRNVEEGRGWKPKVQPPRAEQKTGLFATRSPHRPNPIGMSAVKIERVDGLSVHVRNLDLLDGTPVLDLKPYVAYADAYPEARAGWLDAGRVASEAVCPCEPARAPADPRPAWDVAFDDAALAQLAWLAARGVDLRAPIEAALALGPQPHAYRRIRERAGGGKRLALKEWRVDFDIAERTLVVRGLASGYRAKQLATDPALEVHRAFVAAFVTPSGA
jgi:tRNA-Thr(GGU) m(6)t(6)A37 methyltransferase TsaA